MEEQGLLDYFEDFIIVPVPLHPRRMNWRGFNQSELLGQTLAEKLKLPAEKNLVARKKHTKPQVKLSADERKRNIENAFELSANVDGKKILLVDDLVTSGSTANELAKLLKKHKAAEVWMISAAHG
jgi:ComF family protein